MNEKGKNTVLVFLCVCICLSFGCKTTQTKEESAQVSEKTVVQRDAGAAPSPLSDAARVSPDTWFFEKRALLLLIRADEMLNVYEDRAHTLLFSVYQVADPTAFNDKTKTSEGLKDLLNQDTYSQDSGILSFEKVFVQPGEERMLVMDRAESAKYVGVVAGYFNLDPGLATRLIPIPVVQEKREKTGMAKLNPFADAPKQPPPRPAILKVLFILENDRIETVDIFTD